MAAITFFDRAMEPGFCTMLHDEARATLAGGSSLWRTNHAWDARVRRSSHTVLVRDYDARMEGIIRAQLAESGIVAATQEWRVLGYAWLQLAYIPWHDDGQHAEAATVYLNQEWEVDWGGLFLWRDADDEIRARAPRFNTALRNSGAVYHATTPVMLDAPEPRFTLQLFRES